MTLSGLGALSATADDIAHDGGPFFRVGLTEASDLMQAPVEKTWAQQPRTPAAAMVMLPDGPTTM